LQAVVLVHQEIACNGRDPDEAALTRWVAARADPALAMKVETNSARITRPLNPMIRR